MVRMSLTEVPESQKSVVIAVMGVTGSGKSTFIQTASGEDVKIGHTLHACTQKLSAYRFEHEGYNIILIDTPGFNDTFRTDADILKEIAQWLEFTYTKGFHLSGIIYLHRIADVRMEGSALRNLKMFRKLCGDGPLKNVLLATTFWEKVEADVGNRREQELVSVPEFWGDMVEHGSEVVRFAGNTKSALEIVEQFFGRATVTLKIQNELVNEGKKLVDTDAGASLAEELVALQRKHSEQLAQVEKDMREAIADKDEQLKKILEKEKKRLDRQIERFRDEQEQLRADRRDQMRAMDQDWGAWVRQIERKVEKERMLERRMFDEQMALQRAEIEELKRTQVDASRSSGDREYAMLLYEKELNGMREEFEATRRELEELRSSSTRNYIDGRKSEKEKKKRKRDVFGKKALDVGIGAAGLAATVCLGPLATPLTAILTEFINST